MCVCVYSVSAFATYLLLFFFPSNFWLILSTSLHFLLRGAAPSSHVERSCDKAGEKWGRKEEKRGEEEGRERQKGGKEGVRSRLGAECDQGSRDQIRAIKDGDVQR